jgi:hypothetical protein
MSERERERELNGIRQILWCFDGLYIYIYIYMFLYIYMFMRMCVCVQNIGDSSRTKSVKMRQRGITTIWEGWRKNEGSGTHAHIRREDEQSAVLFFLEIVPNQPEKEATTRRNLLHSFFFYSPSLSRLAFSLSHLSFVSFPSFLR